MHVKAGTLDTYEYELADFSALCLSSMPTGTFFWKEIGFGTNLARLE